jgi:hypothetical protein
LLSKGNERHYKAVKRCSNKIAREGKNTSEEPTTVERDHVAGTKITTVAVGSDPKCGGSAEGSRSEPGQHLKEKQCSREEFLATLDLQQSLNEKPLQHL